MWKPNGGDGVHEMPYWAAQDFLEENGYPTFWQERSAFVNRHPFDAEALAVGFKHLREWPGTRGYCDLRFFQTGGQMNAPAAGATAFVHRDSHWLMVVGLYYDEADSGDAALLAENHAWQDAFYEAMRPLAGGGAYQNFADPTLKDFRQAYYGGNLDRLIDIKRRADPDRVFNFPQAI
jgi:FAD/FMN-containing dehydrogenase